MKKTYQQVVGYADLSDEEMDEQFEKYQIDLNKEMDKGFEFLGPIQMAITSSDILIMMATMVKRG